MKKNTKKIAIVEDNPVERRLYKKWLEEKFGYKIAIFESGEELIQSAIKENDYDLILLDQILNNGMTGLMTFNKLQVIGNQAPVILITSFGSTKLVYSFMKEGGAGYVEKPITDWEYLNCEIKKAIDISEKEALLEQTKREKEQLATEKKVSDAFAHMVSHELRSPITVILGNVQIAQHCLEQGIGGEKELKELLSTSERYARILGTTLDGLLNIVLEGQQASLIETDLNNLVSSAIQDMEKNFFNRKDATIVFKSCDSCLVKTEPNKLFQILLNLVGNARKYSMGKKPIEIICQKGKKDDPYAEILVVDEGVGIQEKDTGKVFDQFTRVKGSEMASGQGLGLFISKRLIESMGGEIWIKRRKNTQGSIFGIRLPKATSPLFA